MDTKNSIGQNYVDHGLNSFLLHCAEDIKKVHGIDANKIKGIHKLSTETRQLFEDFLVNLYNASGLDARTTIKPISVKFVADKLDGSYLKFDYQRCGRSGWLHVKGPQNWY